MDAIKIEGVLVTPLKIIENEKGAVLHGLKKSGEGYSGFGEAYFSKINFNEAKGWKKHREMTLNIIVPMGRIKFVLHDDRAGSKTFGNFSSIELSRDNYKRLTIPNNIWVAFIGLNSDINLLLNIASIEHNDTEVDNLPLNHEKFKAYEWK
jgi:dTDP-4-dehydrorhamnose 3,5-epimerase